MPNRFTGSKKDKLKSQLELLEKVDPILKEKGSPPTRLMSVCDSIEPRKTSNGKKFEKRMEIAKLLKVPKKMIDEGEHDKMTDLTIHERYSIMQDCKMIISECDIKADKLQEDLKIIRKELNDIAHKKTLAKSKIMILIE